jgi:hypothetical protein
MGLILDLMLDRPVPLRRRFAMASHLACGAGAGTIGARRLQRPLRGSDRIDDVEQGRDQDRHGGDPQPPAAEISVNGPLFAGLFLRSGPTIDAGGEGRGLAVLPLASIGAWL